MNPWSALVQAVENVIVATGESLGGHLGAGIFVVVLGVRLVLIPLTYPLAVRTRDRQRIVDRIKPELKALRQELKGDYERVHKETKALHERNGISMVDKAGLVGALIQIPVLIALFQAIYYVSRDTGLATGGILFGIVAAMLAVFGTVTAGQGRSKMIMGLSAVLPILISVWLGAGIALYLVAFYGGGAIQGILMQRRKPPRAEPVVG